MLCPDTHFKPEESNSDMVEIQDAENSWPNAAMVIAQVCSKGLA